MDKSRRGAAEIDTVPRVAANRQKRAAAAHRRRLRRYTIDLPAHMAECDANYLRLMKLFPDVRTREEQKFVVWGAATTDDAQQNAAMVEIKVLERGPYTTLMRIVQLPALYEDETANGDRGAGAEEPESVPWSTNPTLTVRMYHDARSAEVVEYQRQRRFQAVYDYPNLSMRQRDEKAQVNRLLGEFLSVCLERGATVKEVRCADPTA